MKIFAAGIATETNTFSPLPTGLDDFTLVRARDAGKGAALNANLNLAEIWGRPASARGDEFVFSLMAFAQPAGITIRNAYEALREEMLRDLKAVIPVDVVLLMLHGAMVADGYDDCEEDMIRRVREIVGREAVIGVELDLHCHLSRAKISDASVVVTYKEYPHTDINDRARELFELCLAAKLGKIQPTMALFDCRMVGLYPTTRQPMRAFVDAMAEAEGRKGVLSVSFGHGFPYADIPHVGAKMLVVTDNDQVLAEAVAREFGLRVYGLRQQIGFDSLSVSLEKALARALASRKPPVVVADQADNVGGGAPGDSTFALRWLLEHAVSNAGLAIFYDPEVVRIAKKAGPGTVLAVRLGGKLGRSSGPPLDIEVTILSIRETYRHAFPQQSGEPWLFPLGDVVALRCEGEVDIVVSSERCQVFSPRIFADLGIDPARKQLLVVKSMQHFYGEFVPIAGEIIYMAAPGAIAPDPRQIVYRRLDTQRLYPWIGDPLLTAEH